MSGYNGNNGRITYFLFKTDNEPQCVLIDIEALSVVTMEVVLYNSCTAGVPGPAGGLYNHNMCMNNGSGYWAQNLFDNLLPNTTYYLKVRTQGGFTGNLQLTGKYYTPPNENCMGATSITSSLSISDNNACHRPGNVPASQLCAITLENTAWYTYVVQYNGSSTVTIDNIACNNGNGNSNNGFQIGFFTGNCSALVPLTCSSGAGGTVQATATGLTGGSRIYVAIDGYSGSNCSYTINATNAYPLPIKLKDFLATREVNGNRLNWVTVQEDHNAYFEIQRSTDGRTFEGIDRVPGELYSVSEKNYTYLDTRPPLHGYYRLKQVDWDGRFTFSNVVEVIRWTGRIRLLNVTPSDRKISVRLESDRSSKLQASIYNPSGIPLISKQVVVIKGDNSFDLPIPFLASGIYILVISDDDDRSTYVFMK
jgi:hypothetical protein